MNPWEDPCGIWDTQPKFFSWLRGQFRRSWTRYPVSKNFKDQACRPATPEDGLSKATKLCAPCAQCGVLFGKSNLQVDHIFPAGSLKTFDDVGVFVFRLLTNSKNMRLVCKPCHEIITLAERLGCSFDEAKKKKGEISEKKEAAAKRKADAEKKKPGIAFSKLSDSDQVEKLLSLGVGEIPKNKKLRRVLFDVFSENPAKTTQEGEKTSSDPLRSDGKTFRAPEVFPKTTGKTF